MYFSMTTHGLYSDVHWRCSDEEEDWFDAWFDDTSWSNAFPATNHSTYHTTYIRENFNINTKLVWHYDPNTTDIFCRVRLFYGKDNVLYDAAMLRNPY